MKNIDAIRAMSDEEIARLLSGNIDCNICKILFNNEVDCVHCEDHWREWLHRKNQCCRCPRGTP